MIMSANEVNIKIKITADYPLNSDDKLTVLDEVRKALTNIDTLRGAKIRAVRELTNEEIAEALRT